MGELSSGFEKLLSQIGSEARIYPKGILVV